MMNKNIEHIEIEQALLGAVLLDPHVMPEVLSIITSASFSDRTHIKLFAILSEMHSKREDIDLYTVSVKLKTINELRGKISYLALLTQMVGSGANVMTHAILIHDAYVGRQLLAFSQKLTAMVLEGADISEALHLLSTTHDAIISKISSSSSTKVLLTSLSDAITALHERMAARKEGKSTSVSTGLMDLDKMTGGWMPGNLIVLAGRPGMGKTAIALKFGITAAILGDTSIIFSMEMSNLELTNRIWAMEHDIPTRSFTSGNITPLELDSAISATQPLERLPFYIDDRANLKIRDIRNTCQKMKARGRLGLVIVDYLQLLDLGGRNNNRERDVAIATRELKVLAKELGVPIILLCQLSRKIEERATTTKNGTSVPPTPMLSDLRESGAIEQDADIVLFVDRPAKYKVEYVQTRSYGTISTKGLGRLVVAKQRNGPTGSAFFSHNPQLSKITDYVVTDMSSEATQPQDNEDKPF